MKKLISTLLLAISTLCVPAARAQSGASGLPVNQVGLPSPFPTVREFFYDGNNVLQYVCTAQQIQPVTAVSVAGATLTNIVVLTNVGTVTTVSAHNLYVGARVKVSGSATTALNGVYTIASVPSSTTYTIATTGVGNATYNDATLVISTSNPLLNAAVWAVQVFINTGPSNSIADSHFAIATVGLNPTSQTPMNIACTNRAQF